jgi:hypothetical protein
VTTLDRTRASWSDGRTLRALVDFQLWCLGQDIRHADGNLLLSYGAARERPPAGIEGSSRYSIAGPDASVLILWGFGLVLSTSDAPPIMLRRHQRNARLLPARFCAADVWQPDDLPRGVAARDDAQRRTVACGLAALAAQLVEYERWVRRQLGPDWRQTCHARMPRAKRVRTPGDPSLLAESWSGLPCDHPRPTSAMPAMASPSTSPLALSA